MLRVSKVIPIILVILVFAPIAMAEGLQDEIVTSQPEASILIKNTVEIGNR